MDYDELFDKEEFDNKDNYDYYFDIDNKSLHKRRKDGKGDYDFVVSQVDNYIYKDWMETQSLDTADLYKIEDFNVVLRYMNDYLDDLINGIYDVDLKKYIDISDEG